MLLGLGQLLLGYILKLGCTKKTKLSMHCLSHHSRRYGTHLAHLCKNCKHNKGVTSGEINFGVGDQKA